MKAVKIVAYVLGGILLLVALLAVIALLPGVQTWAVRRAVASQPGMKIEIGRVAAGLSKADLRDLRVAQDGLVITAKNVTASYSAWDYVFGKKINVENATATDLVVDLRGTANAKAADGKDATAAASTSGADASKKARAANAKDGGPKQPFNGALAQAKLPFEVRVVRVSAQGRALLPADRTVNFDLQGAGIETGKRGTLEWKADFTDPTKDAPLSAAKLTGTSGVHIAPDGRIDLVEVDATVAATGPKLPPDQIKLQAKAEQPAAGSNENYAVTLALARGTSVEPLLKGAAEFRAASRDFVGTWDLAVRSEQLAAVLQGFGLPEVMARGAGKFSFKPDTGAATASGDLQGNLARLEQLAPELASVGSMQFRASFDGGLADDVAQFERLQLDLTAADGRRIAQIATAQRVGFSLADKRVTLANPQSELARVSVQALPLAWAQPFLKGLTIERGDLSLALAIEAEADGSRVRARALEPLAVRTVTIRGADKKPLVEEVTLTVNPRLDYSATRVVAELADLRVTMPAGDSVTGNVSADVTDLAKTPAIAFNTQLQAKLVAAHKPYLPAGFDPGPLAIATTAQGRLAGDALNVAKSSTTVTRDGGPLFANVELQQPLTANLKAQTFTVPRPEQALARAKLGEVPLAWAEAFVKNMKFAGTLAGATLDVSARSAEDLSVNTVEPVALRGVGLIMDGKPMLQSLDLTANLTATKRKESVAFEVRRVEVKQGQALLAGVTVTGEAKLGAKLALTAKGNLEADIPTLTAQPAAAQFATLSRGKITSDFDATLGDAIQAKANLAARGLVAKQDNRPLGDLEVKLDANLRPDGSGTLNAPVVLASAQRRSDVAVNGTFGRATDKKTLLFNGSVTSNQIFIDDFQPLAGLAPADETPKAHPTTMPAPQPPIYPRGGGTPSPRTQPSSQPAPQPQPPVASKPAGRDTEPFWKGVNGKVAVDLKRVVYGKDYTIGNVRGNATITDSRIALDGLEGTFNQNPFKLNAAVAFNAQAPQPYSLTGATNVQNFDVGELLRAANPRELPALEAKMSVTANLNGNGATVGDLAKNVYGRFELNSTQGVMRYLARKGQAGEVVNIASTIAGVIGAAKGSDTTVAVAELARFLNEVRFDSLKLQVERGADLGFKITSLELLSPLLRTTGSGTVANRGPDAPQKQPMEILLQLGAKGELAHLFNRVRILGDKQDEKGYQLASHTFTIGGTPAAPDSSALWKTILTEAARTYGLPALQDLLNRGRE